MHNIQYFKNIQICTRVIFIVRGLYLWSSVTCLCIALISCGSGPYGFRATTSFSPSKKTEAYVWIPYGDATVGRCTALKTEDRNNGLLYHCDFPGEQMLEIDWLSNECLQVKILYCPYYYPKIIPEHVKKYTNITITQEWVPSTMSEIESWNINEFGIICKAYVFMSNEPSVNKLCFTILKETDKSGQWTKSPPLTVIRGNARFYLKHTKNLLEIEAHSQHGKDDLYFMVPSNYLFGKVIKVGSSYESMGKSGIKKKPCGRT